MELTAKEKEVLARLGITGTLKCDHCGHRIASVMYYKGAQPGTTYCSNSCFEVGEQITRSRSQRNQQGTTTMIDKTPKRDSEESPKKKKATEAEEAPKKKKRDAEEAPEEKPAKKKKPVDDDEDEDEVPKKKKKVTEAPAEDKPAKKKKRDAEEPADDEDEDEDEAPKKKKKASEAAPADAKPAKDKGKDKKDKPAKDKPAKESKPKEKKDKPGENPYRAGTMCHKVLARLLGGKPRTFEQLFKDLEAGDGRRMLGCIIERGEQRGGYSIKKNSDGTFQLAS